MQLIWCVLISMERAEQFWPRPPVHYPINEQSYIKWNIPNSWLVTTLHCNALHIQYTCIAILIETLANLVSNDFLQVNKTAAAVIQSPFEMIHLRNYSVTLFFSQSVQKINDMSVFFIFSTIFHFIKFQSTSMFAYSSTIPSRTDWPLRFNQIKNIYV